MAKGKFIDRTGERRIINGKEIKMLEYINYQNCKVLLSDGVITNCDYRSFLNRKIPYSNSTHAKIIGKNQTLNRKGEKRELKDGTIEIIRYNTNHDIDILLENGEIIYNTRYDNFCNLKYATSQTRKEDFTKRISELNKGKNGNRKIKYGIAILDSMCVNDMGKLKNSYKKWIMMLKRSFDEDYKKKHPTYKDVTCCKEWLLYSNFDRWYNENYYDIENERMELDKDILIKGNKTYSPDTCVFVPHNINILFVKNDSNRNSVIGTFKVNNKYISSISKKSKREYLGRYDTIEEAFNSYKTEKEKYIKQVANEYKNKIPKKLYEAMYCWKVEAND